MFRMDNWKCSMGALVFAAFMAQPATAQEIYIGVYGGGGGVNLDGTSTSTRQTGFANQFIDVPGMVTIEGETYFGSNETRVEQIITTTVSHKASAAFTGGGLIGMRFGQFRGELDTGVTSFKIDRTTRTRHQLSPLNPMYDILSDDAETAKRHEIAQLEHDIASQNAIETDSFRANAVTVTANALLDIKWDNESLWTPYLGGGLGVGWISDDGVFVWNLQAGVSYNLSEKSQMIVGYKFERLEDTEYGDLDSHLGRVGLIVSLQ